MGKVSAVTERQPTQEETKSFVLEFQKVFPQCYRSLSDGIGIAGGID